MKLSIIIPVFNEEKTIALILKRISKVSLPGIEKEILVVDDGSTDATASIIQGFLRSGTSETELRVQDLKSFGHKKNLGKGTAVRTGMKNATGDYVLIQDADLEYNPKDIARLIDPVQKNKAKVVYGTRLNRLPNIFKDERTPQFLLHYFGNRVLSFLTSILYGQWITDMETGYKLFPKEALSGINLNARRFDFEPEITAKLLKKGYKILEIPISTNPRGYDEGKKLNTFRDGILALWTLFKYRLIN